MRFVCLAAAALLAACSSEGGTPPAASGGMAGSAGATGDDTLIVPEGLNVIPLAGGNGVLNVTALTLVKGPTNTEIYAALRNDGAVHACSAAFGVELFDAAELSLGAGIGGLLAKRFFRLTDGSDNLAACVAPGDVTMAAIMDLPADIVIDDIRTVVYRCPYFELEVMPIPGLTVTEVEGASENGGTVYTGTLVNELDVAVTNPGITVFPLNRAGRPLGAATGSESVEIPPGGSWEFRTDVVNAVGVDAAAYPTAALAP